MERIHQVEGDREELLLDLDEIARAGARKMLAEALEAEVQDYLQAAKGERDGHGHALVVRNGYAREREVLCGAGSVEVRAPRVNDKRVEENGERRRFKSVIVPPYMRRSPKVTEVLPLLYLHGLSSGDFVPALQEFFGSEAGLSSAAITRLSEHWQQEHEHFMSRDLSERDYVYLWVDGIHTNVRLGEARLRRSVVLPGCSRGETRWHKGVGGPCRWLPGIHRKLGRVTEGPKKACHESTGAGGRRRGVGLLECTGGRISRDPLPERLGS
jgi:transposase-like protein